MNQSSPEEIVRCLTENQIQEKICSLVEKTINEKYEVMFKNIVTKAPGKIVEEINDKMLSIITNAFNAKLDKLHNELVDSPGSEELIKKLIVDLGLKFNEALNDRDDKPNLELYDRFIKFYEKEKEEEGKTKKNGGRKNQQKTKINKTKKPKIKPKRNKTKRNKTKRNKTKRKHT